MAAMASSKIAASRVVSLHHLAGALSLGPLLLGMYARLLSQGYVTTDCAPAPERYAAVGPEASPLWMGVWKGPSSPCHRRIDFKVRLDTSIS